MKCPFQWNEEELFSGSGKVTRHIFRNCDGDCAAYVPEKTIGQFTVPAMCRMLADNRQNNTANVENISEAARTALDRIGAKAHGEFDPEGCGAKTPEYRRKSPPPPPMPNK